MRGSGAGWALRVDSLEPLGAWSVPNKEPGNASWKEPGVENKKPRARRSLPTGQTPRGGRAAPTSTQSQNPEGTPQRSSWSSLSTAGETGLRGQGLDQTIFPPASAGHARQRDGVGSLTWIAWAQIPVLALTTSVAQGNLLYNSGPQFSHLGNGTIITEPPHWVGIKIK